MNWVVNLKATLSAAALALVAAPAAHADYYTPSAGLQCSGNLIALRFGGWFNEDPMTFFDLPPDYSARWSNVPFAKDNRCTLANGQKVVMRAGAYEARAWGMGGGDPPAFFSLWIDGRKVFSIENYKSGYGSSEPSLNTIFLSSTVQERCAFPRDEDARGESVEDLKVTCTSKPLAIKGIPVDLQMPTEEDLARVGSMSIAARASPSFCRLFVQPDVFVGKDGELANDPVSERVVIPETAQRFFERGPEDIYPPASPDRMDFVRPHATFDYFDLWNRAEKVPVVRFYGDWKFFSGDVLLARTGATPEKDIRAMMAQVEGTGGGTTYYRDLAEKNGWVTMDENPDVYTHWTPFRLEGVTYLLEEQSPSRAVLHLPSRNLTVAELCVFQRIEPYF